MALDAFDLSVRDISFRCWRSGRGFPLVLLHGAGPGAGTEGYWRFVLEPLSERYAIFATDLIGFGKSGRKFSPPYFDISLWLDQIGVLLDHIGGERVGFVGHSLSGALSLKTAARDPRVSAVLATGTMGVSVPLTPAIETVWTAPRDVAALERVARLLFFDPSFITPEFLETRLDTLRVGGYLDYFDRMFVGDKKSYIDAAVLTDDEIAAVSVEVALVHGDTDLLMPCSETSAVLAQRLSHARLDVLARCGHSPAIEYPAALTKAVYALFD